MSFTESKRIQGMVPTDQVRQNLPLVTIGAIFAWLAVIVYASSNSIVTLLVDIGKANPVASGRNAITYCNLLFLGSLISVVPMVLLFHKDWTRKKLAKLSRHDWAILTVSAFLSSAVTPGLFFYALEHTTVTNVILIGRIEPPLFLLATWAFLNEDLNPWAMWAGLVALVGAVVMIGMRGNGALFHVRRGRIGDHRRHAFIHRLDHRDPRWPKGRTARHLLGLSHGAGDGTLFPACDVSLRARAFSGSLRARCAEMDLDLRHRGDRDRAVLMEPRAEICTIR